MKVPILAVGFLLLGIPTTIEAFTVDGIHHVTKVTAKVTTKDATLYTTRLLSTTRSSSIDGSTAASSLGFPVCQYHQVTIPTSQQGPPRQDVSVEDLTPILVELIESSGLKQGTITVLSRHTTTAITINEREKRLAQDMASFLLELAPPDERSDSPRRQLGKRYFHNDIDQRPDGDEEAQRCRENGWEIDSPEILEEWRAQEPINSHSHLLSMLLGSSESIPVVDGKMVIGQWQSVLLVDLDGPRDRTVGIQLMGFTLLHDSAKIEG